MVNSLFDKQVPPTDQWASVSYEESLTFSCVQLFYHFIDDTMCQQILLIVINRVIQRLPQWFGDLLY